MDKNKKQLGQFFTTNSSYILQGFENFVFGKVVQDPFAGSMDLIDWAKKNKAKKAYGFDVDKNLVDNKNVFLNDSICNPKKYNFVLTNPPYLHKNKANEITKSKYFCNKNISFEDLYQISLNSILNSEEGVVIVPLNFLSAENSSKIRKIFFSKFHIVKLNIFTQQVFDDTTYNVISFYFKKNKEYKKNFYTEVHIFPNNFKYKVEFAEKYNWQLGGEFISKIKNTKNLLGVYRLTLKDIKKGKENIRMAFNHIKDVEEYSLHEELKKAIENNIILLKAIDGRSNKIKMEDIRKYKVYGLVGKESSRNMAHLMFKKPLTIEEQKKLIELFNKELNEAREKHLSFFLTNFRDNNRKRIGFDFAYKLLNYVYYEKFPKQPAMF